MIKQLSLLKSIHGFLRDKFWKAKKMHQVPQAV